MVIIFSNLQAFTLAPFLHFEHIYIYVEHDLNKFSNKYDIKNIGFKYDCIVMTTLYLAYLLSYQWCMDCVQHHCRWQMKLGRLFSQGPESWKYQWASCVWRCYVNFLTQQLEPYILFIYLFIVKLLLEIFRGWICIFLKLRNCVQNFHQQLYCLIT